MFVNNYIRIYCILKKHFIARGGIPNGFLVCIHICARYAYEYPYIKKVYFKIKHKRVLKLLDGLTLVKKINCKRDKSWVTSIIELPENESGGRFRSAEPDDS